MAGLRYRETAICIAIRGTPRRCRLRSVIHPEDRSLSDAQCRTYLGERFINLEMVKDGFAWRYPQYDKLGEFAAAEADARDPVPPREWRREKRPAVWSR